jgi:hypothetical protein
MGIFPRVVDADLDGRKDLLVGEAEGNIRLYLNINTDADPSFDGGTLLDAGPAGSKTVIDVGQRTTPNVVDWDNDGRRDIIVGEKGGKVLFYRNTGTDSAWDLEAAVTILDGGADLIVPALRSSPHVEDYDGDGAKDLLLGNTAGQILTYFNTGTDAAPLFNGYTQVESDGSAIDLPGDMRARPFVCDWNDDGIRDLLIGYGDGLVRLYIGIDDLTECVCETPTSVRLLPAWPNPFNPVTTIGFELDSVGPANLRIYDASGRLVRTLAHGIFEAGLHEKVWNGTGDQGQRVSSGVYFCRFEAGGFSRTQKLVLLR